ncbi:MAG: ABC transporter substrate-binding protein [Rhizobiaceae bacterium]
MVWKTGALGQALTVSRRWLMPAAGAMILAASFQAAAQEPFKIGAVFNISGPFAALGTEQSRGAEMAVAEINRVGGVDGRQLELLLEDDQSKPDIGVPRATKLINQDKVSALVSAYINSILAFAKIAEKAKVPVFAISNSAGLTQTGNDYIFRASIGDPIVLKEMLQLLRNSGKTKIAVLYQGDAYGGGAFSLIKGDLTGLDLVAAESFPVQASLDLTPQLTRIRSKSPDAIILWCAPSQAITALKNAQQLEINTPIFGSVAIASQNVVTGAGSAADGVVVPDVLDRQNPSPALAAFLEKYKERYGAYPSTPYSVYAWDAIQVVAAALKDSGGKSEIVKQNAEKLQDVEGLTGRFRYSPENREGLSAKSIRWVTVKDGKFVPYDIRP